MLKSIDTGWEGNHLETELRRELKRAAVCPSAHPAAIPRCFAPAHPQQCREVGTHLGKVCQVAGVRCGAVRGADDADQGGELRAVGAGARVRTCRYTPSTSGFHGWSVGGSTSVGWDQGGRPDPSRAQGGVRSCQGKGSTRLNYTGFDCPTEGTAASEGTRAS